MHNTLALLSNAVGFQRNEGLYDALYNMLNFVNQSIGKLLNSDCTNIFLWDAESQEFWSLNPAIEDNNQVVEMRISPHSQVAREFGNFESQICINSHKPLENIVSLSQISTQSEYPIYNILAFPLVNQQKNLVAVVELLNKIKLDISGRESLENRLDFQGFTRADKEQICQCANSLLPILEGFQSFHRELKTIQGQQAIETLWTAISCVSQSIFNPKEILANVMNAAKKLTNADRSTLWLLDRQNQLLWTKIPLADGNLKEMKVPIGIGFAGKVAASGVSLIIPFDLYNHPDAETAKKTDEKTCYRTCSLLCMPVFNPDGDLLGVTQLLNKRKNGNFSEYNKENWPQVPDYFKASFDDRDRRYMEIFNNQVAIVLQNAQQQNLL